MIYEGLSHIKKVCMGNPLIVAFELNTLKSSERLNFLTMRDYPVCGQAAYFRNLQCEKLG